LGDSGQTSIQDAINGCASQLAILDFWVTKLEFYQTGGD